VQFDLATSSSSSGWQTLALLPLLAGPLAGDRMRARGRATDVRGRDQRSVHRSHV